MFKRWLSLQSSKPLLLLAPRRAGKSTLLKLTYPQYKYVTLDDLDDLEFSKKDPKGFIESLGTKFIIDEAQRNVAITLPLKKFIDEKKGHFILTGSGGFSLLDATADTLAGRIEIKRLPPCCFGENLGVQVGSILTELDIKQKKQISRLVDDYQIYGGFPEVLTTSNLEEKKGILKNYKNTYFTRDLATIANLENIEGLKALFQALMKDLGSRYEYSSLQKETGLTYITAKKYLNTLLSSGLAFKLYGYHFSSTKRYLSSAKTYFIDNGIITSLTDECSRGQVVENMVISEIEKRRRIDEIICDELFYYESAGGREIDLIVEEKSRVTAIEIKSSTSITGRDLRNIREFKTSKKKLRRWIIYMGSEQYVEDGIHIIPFINFYQRRWA